MATPNPTTPTPAGRGEGAGAGLTRGTAANGPESLSDLEREVLDEYELVLSNLNELSPLLASLAADPTAAVLDTLRVLERKASLVSTLLKASVYSIVLQQQMLEGDDLGDDHDLGLGHGEGMSGAGSE